MRLAAVFVFTTSNLGRSSGALPRWFCLAGLGVGTFLLLSASLSAWLLLAFPLWLLTLSVILVLRIRRLPTEAILAASGRLLPAGDDHGRDGAGVASPRRLRP
jgi:hypothetical protein